MQISNSTSKTSNLWVSDLRPNPQAQLRLFCFPYAGAGSAVFHSWGRLMPPQIELCLINLPGRERRIKEVPYTRLSPLVESLGDSLAFFHDKSFAFFGHSMGALISFEVARYLHRKHKLQPIHLFVSGRRAPQIPDRHPPLRNLSDTELIKEVEYRYGGLPEIILQDTDLLQLFLPILRADLTVLETAHYEPEPPLDCPISVFGGRQDNTTTEVDLVEWREQTMSTFSLQMFPGDHFFIQNTKTVLVQTLVRELTAYIGDSSRAYAR